MKSTDIDWAAMSKDQKISYGRYAKSNAEKAIKKGDRITATRCGGMKITYIFDHWDGHWAVSKSRIDDISPIDIYRLNGVLVDFCEGWSSNND